MRSLGEKYEIYRQQIIDSLKDKSLELGFKRDSSGFACYLCGEAIEGDLVGVSELVKKLDIEVGFDVLTLHPQCYSAAMDGEFG